MTLLYVDDQKDYLLGLFSRYFDEIMSVKFSDLDALLKKRDDICCMVINVRHNDPLPDIVSIKYAFPESVIILVLHEEIDVRICIGIGIERFILYPYDEEQIDTMIRNVVAQKERADGLAEMQRRDHITALLNAEFLHHKIKHQSQDTALLIIDIDNFDLINTLYGMEIGDKVLAKVAGYLHKLTPSNCALHRLEADEFVIYMDKPVKGQEEIISKQIKSFFELMHFQVADIDFNLRVSIGIAMGDSSRIFHHAKVALKEAKASGRNSIVYYRENSPFLKKQRQTLYWINEVKSALEEDRIQAFFQPIRCNKTEKIIKYEALCRIVSVSKEILSPNDFLDAALLGGLLTNVTRDMIDKAFKMFSNTDYDFSINVTREDFQEEYILPFLKRKCYLYNIAPSRVFIEIVENISFDVADGYLNQIQALSEHGFKLAIDDFGTESSNYSRFLNIQADYLKIDGRFIRNIDQDTNSRIIVESIVEFARKIGAETIAEYVNSPSVHKIVKELGVDYSQGFFVGKPQPELAECEIETKKLDD